MIPSSCSGNDIVNSPQYGIERRYTFVIDGRRTANCSVAVIGITEETIEIINDENGSSTRRGGCGIVVW